MRFVFLGLLCLLFSLGLYDCANKSSPQGGPKDTLKPYILQAIPSNGSVNYTGKVIVIRFNEWIAEKNLQKELLIVPPIKEYIPKIVRDRIEIRLSEPLRPNTTYSFNFRQGIADITEGNIATTDTLKRLPLRLTFSTGDFLDSLEVAGVARSLMTNEPAKDATVALYDINDTLTIRKHAPNYFTQTDANGKFRVPNLKAGKYRLYVFQDANQDFVFQPTELVGFPSQVLTLPDTTKEITVKLLKDDKMPPEIQKSRAVGQEYDIVWNEYIKEVTSSFPTYILQADNRTVRFFNPDKLTDSLKIKLQARDSLGNVQNIETTIAFKLPTDNRKKEKRVPLAVAIRTHAKEGFEQDVALDFVFEQPVQQAFLERIFAQVDNDTLKRLPLCQTDTIRHATWNASKTVLTIRRKAFFKERLTLMADSGTFIGVKGDSSKTIRQVFNLKKASDFGSISGNVRTDKKAFWLQLINDKHEIIRQVANAKTFDFKYLPADTYKIRILIDENNNGVWDMGDLDKLIQPEPVLFFTLQNDGKLKERWELQGHNIAF